MTVITAKPVPHKLLRVKNVYRKISNVGVGENIACFTYKQASISRERKRVAHKHYKKSQRCTVKMLWYIITRKSIRQTPYCNSLHQWVEVLPGSLYFESHKGTFFSFYSIALLL